MKDLNIPKELLEKLKTQSDVEDLVGSLYKGLIQKMLEAEMDEHLGYQKNDREGKQGSNHRNGKSSKTVKTSKGSLPIDVPRDRESSFEPIIVPKHKRMSQTIEDAVISFYAKGLSTTDIEEQIEEIYGVQLSSGSVSNITHQVLDYLKEWQVRPLDPVYFILWVDGIQFRVRQDGKILSKTVYVVIGLSNTGHKDVLGLWISETESASFWMNVFSELQSRGVEDALIICSDNLKGMSDGIRAIYPQSTHQTCIVHQIRNASKYVGWKDRKAFARDMKPIYQAVNIDQAEQALQHLKKIWGDKYPHSIRSWENNWETLTAFLEYPEQIRRIIYTTNTIESFNSMIRRDTSKKTIFPSDDAVFKSLYLAIRSINKKWKNTIWNWGLIANQFLVIFEHRCKI